MLCDDCLHAAICENVTQGNCDWYLSEIRWTDKVYLDSQGNIRSSDGCPTDLITRGLINKVMTNIGCARPIVSGKEKKNERNSY